MITVDQALTHLFALARVMEVESVPLIAASGRVLAEPVAARRTQPPFAASAMDGYALRGGEVREGATFDVIGEAAAGHRFTGAVGTGQAVRIFTGAPVPEGADCVVIQEDTTRDGDTITLKGNLSDGTHIRPAGGDFTEGAQMTAPRRLAPQDIALLAAMNVAEVPVYKRPVVAIAATGDELVIPGEAPGPDQIIASNNFGLAALLTEAGAEVRMLPIARDTPDALAVTFALAQGADLLVTIGGASVGDHDLVAAAAAAEGMQRAFYKVAMRPGKPLMAGRLGDMAMIGLPGNPVSAMVCGHIFLLPFLRAMLGLGQAAAPRMTAPLAQDIAANGPREHYMRATLTADGIAPFDNQDSALLSVLCKANALLIRPPSDGPQAAGTLMEYVPLTAY